MGCERITFDDETRAIVCTRGVKAGRCCKSGCKGPGYYLCDHTDEHGRLCSKPLCGHHRVTDGDRDLCPAHAEEEREARAGRKASSAPPPLTLRCSSKGCHNLAPLPCSTPSCTGTVCGSCASKRGGRWACGACLPARPPAQTQLPLGARP